jgi:hypothetical protein
MKRAAIALLILGLLTACRREAEFSPPADGRLTEAQVRKYLKAEKEMVKTDPREARWVADRVREARMAGVASGLDQKIWESRRRILRSLEEKRRNVTDPAKRSDLDRQIAEVRRLLQGAPEEVSDSVRFNAELVARVEGR